jgi:hypothetical protein
MRRDRTRSAVLSLAALAAGAACEPAERSGGRSAVEGFDAWRASRGWGETSPARAEAAPARAGLAVLVDPVCTGYGPGLGRVRLDLGGPGVTPSRAPPVAPTLRMASGDGPGGAALGCPRTAAAGRGPAAPGG